MVKQTKQFLVVRLASLAHHLYPNRTTLSERTEVSESKGPIGSKNENSTGVNPWMLIRGILVILSFVILSFTSNAYASTEPVEGEKAKGLDAIEEGLTEEDLEIIDNLEFLENFDLLDEDLSFLENIENLENYEIIEYIGEENENQEE